MKIHHLLFNLALVFVFIAPTAAREIQAFRRLFEIACQRCGLSLKAAALCMDIDQGQLRRQLDGDQGALWAWRLLRLPREWWAEFQVLAGEETGADVVTQRELARFMRLSKVQPVPARAEIRPAEKTGVMR